MKILLDEYVTKKLRAFLNEHEVFTVTQMGWNGFRNGNLIEKAIGKNFDLIITIDKNLRFQQNIQKKDLIVVVFDSPTSKISDLEKFIPKFCGLCGSFERKNVYILSL